MDARRAASSAGAGVRNVIESRGFRWAVALTVAPVLLAALLIALFGWNWLRAPLAHQISNATGRSFAIRGDLEIHLSLHPRIVANDLVFGNAPWSTVATMASVKRLDVSVDLPKLLTGRWEFPAITLSEPQLVLEIGKDGRANWVFDRQASDTPLELPVIGALTVDHGNAIYRDPRNNTDLALEIKTLDAAAKFLFKVGVADFAVKLRTSC